MINRSLHPFGDGNGTYMAAFPDEVYDRPMLLALLKIRELQLCQFSAPQSATEQYGENGSITFSFERVRRGSL